MTSSLRHVNLIPKIGGMPIGASIALGCLPVANIRFCPNPFNLTKKISQSLVSNFVFLYILCLFLCFDLNPHYSSYEEFRPNDDQLARFWPSVKTIYLPSSSSLLTNCQMMEVRGLFVCLFVCFVICSHRSCDTLFQLGEVDLVTAVCPCSGLSGNNTARFFCLFVCIYLFVCLCLYLYLFARISLS